MLKPLHAVFAAALLCALAPVARAADTAYDIKFSHPAKPGEKLALTIDMEDAMSVRVEKAGAPPQKSSLTSVINLEADMMVNAVDKQGRESSFHLVIKKLHSGQVGDVPEEALPAGAQVDVVYQDGKASFTRKDGELTQKAQVVLGHLFQAPHSDLTEDQMFGASEKKKIGDSWKADPQAIAADAKGQGIELELDKIAGVTKLVQVKDINGTPAIELEARVEVTGFTVPNLGKATDGKLGLTLTEQVPTDPANPSSKSTVRNSLHAVFDLGEKGTLTRDANSTRTDLRILAK